MSEPTQEQIDAVLEEFRYCVPTCPSCVTHGCDAGGLDSDPIPMAEVIATLRAEADRLRAAILRWWDDGDDNALWRAAFGALSLDAARQGEAGGEA